MKVNYRVYLSLICQLQFQSRAKLFFNEEMLLVEVDKKKNLWCFSTKMSEGALESLPVSNRLYYLSSGPFLQKNKVKNSLHLVLETRPVTRYIDFRNIMNLFFNDLQMYEELVH